MILIYLLLVFLADFNWSLLYNLSLDSIDQFSSYILANPSKHNEIVRITSIITKRFADLTTRLETSTASIPTTPTPPRGNPFLNMFPTEVSPSNCSNSASSLLFDRFETLSSSTNDNSDFAAPIESFPASAIDSCQAAPIEPSPASAIEPSPASAIDACQAAPTEPCPAPAKPIESERYTVNNSFRKMYVFCSNP
jgi:hypothetical protein